MGKELGNRKMCQNERVRCVCVCASQGFSLNFKFQSVTTENKGKWILESGAVVPDEATAESPNPPFPSYNRNESV